MNVHPQPMRLLALPPGVDVREFFDSLTQGIMIFDRDGVILDVNGAAAGIIDVERQFLVGRTIANLPAAVDANGEFLTDEERPVSDLHPRVSHRLPEARNKWRDARSWADGGWRVLGVGTRLTKTTDSCHSICRLRAGDSRGWPFVTRVTTGLSPRATRRECATPLRSHRDDARARCELRCARRVA